MKKIIRLLIFISIILFLFFILIPNIINPKNDQIEKELKKIGYTNNEISIILDKMNENEIEDLLNKEKQDKLFDYIDINYFKYEYLDRYIKYKKIKDYNISDIVMHVNIGLDKEFYTDINEIKDPDNLLVLVNKFNALPDNFVPKNLITLSNNYSYKNQKMQEIAANNIIALIDDARKEGYSSLFVLSGYRTRDYQNGLYTNSIRKNGIAHAEKYSARPRHSEHETGLVADLSVDGTVEETFANTNVYKWLKNNCYKYGFIERYPKEKEYITGYGYEPWHYRYVGIEVATIIHNENITFEEYHVKYLNY